jgi:hypothetical protein
MGAEEKSGRWKVTIHNKYTRRYWNNSPLFFLIQELYKSIETNSAQHFASNIITRLSKVHNAPGRRFSVQLPKLDSNILKEACKQSEKRLSVYHTNV